MIFLHSVLLSLSLLSSAPQDTSAPVPEPVREAVPEAVPKTACVIDPAGTDSLSPVDRVVLQGALEDLLARAGRSMSAPSMSAPSISAPCEEPWSALHTRRAGGVLVSLSARGREVSAFATATGAIPAIYERLVTALISGAEVSAPEIPEPRVVSAVSPAEPLRRFPDARALPPRQAGPWHIYLNLGLGGAPALLDDFSTAISFGYRYTVDHWGLDLSAQVVSVHESAEDAEDIRVLLATTAFRARTVYVARPSAKSSLFALAGFGWGTSELDFTESFFVSQQGGGVSQQGERVSQQGEGIELHVSVGYETSRKASLHYLFELGVTLPMYRLRSEFTDSSLEIGPLVTLTAGLGWSPGVYNAVLP